MTLTAVDASVVVAALASWHGHHARALAALADGSRPGRRLVLPVNALLQSYSVLTRLPPAYRIPPRGALALLTDAFERRADVVSTAPGDAWMMLRAGVESGAVGGGIHDFEILDDATRAGATRLLTLNPKDFLRFGDRGVEIVVP